MSPIPAVGDCCVLSGAFAENSGFWSVAEGLSCAGTKRLHNTVIPMRNTRTIEDFRNRGHRIVHLELAGAFPFSSAVVCFHCGAIASVIRPFHTLQNCTGYSAGWVTSVNEIFRQS